VDLWDQEDLQDQYRLVDLWDHYLQLDLEILKDPHHQLDLVYQKDQLVLEHLEILQVQLVQVGLLVLEILQVQ
jgi:hypothetical protein